MGDFSKAAVEEDKRCPMGIVVDTFDDEDLERYTVLAKKKKWIVIRKALDFKVGQHSVGDHAKGTCGCTGSEIKGHGLIV